VLSTTHGQGRALPLQMIMQQSLSTAHCYN
jgi:hypothetical protein